jgi:hypothetical protein
MFSVGEDGQKINAPRYGITEMHMHSFKRVEMHMHMHMHMLGSLCSIFIQKHRNAERVKCIPRFFG